MGRLATGRQVQAARALLSGPDQRAAPSKWTGLRSSGRPHACVLTLWACCRAEPSSSSIDIVGSARATAAAAPSRREPESYQELTMRGALVTRLVSMLVLRGAATYPVHERSIECSIATAKQVNLRGTYPIVTAHWCASTLVARYRMIAYPNMCPTRRPAGKRASHPIRGWHVPSLDRLLR